jgi:hypothetical protein
MTPDIRDPRAISPTLHAYLARIEDAEAATFELRSLRRFTMKLEDRDKYHHDAIVVKLSKEGDVWCDKAEHQPEKGEPEKIKAELADAIKGWPKSCAASPHGDADVRRILKGRGYTHPELFVFRNKENEIVFIQHRIRNEDDEQKKRDLPWSYWDDGSWRQMEPDGELPLFGLEQNLKNASRIFLHEGASSARAVRAMVALAGDDSYEYGEIRKARPHLSKDHPWFGDLKFGVHLGWPGGAPNPHRVDWTPITSLDPTIPAIIVCDNDVGGKNAARKISKLLEGRRVRMIRFENPFIDHFDLANEFPKECWMKINASRGRISATRSNRRLGRRGRWEKISTISTSYL